MDVLIDSDVILDVVTEDPVWYKWSSEALSSCADRHNLVINHVIYAEVSLCFDRIEDLEYVLPAEIYRRDLVPWEAAFLAAKCFFLHKQAGGGGFLPLPYFYIGAHAAVADMALLTRNGLKYRTYFPRVKLICPDESESERSAGNGR